MDRKKLILLAVALIVAIGTALMARSMFATSAAPQVQAAQVPDGPRVLVAQRALPVGTIITADALQFKMWPAEMVQDVYYIDGKADLDKLLGTVVRYPVTAGQPVTQGMLVKPGDRGFLAAALGPGMRAVTVPVSVKTGVGGFVFPGDRVDMVLTQQVTGDGPPLKVAETILQNLRVLATDQSTTTRTVEGKTVVQGFRTVTLEVTPRIAEKIAVAQTIGQLSLSLRSLADNQGELDRAIASGDVTVPDDAPPAEEEAILRMAMNRPQSGRITAQTGGDVSRFQRRTVPPRESNGSSSVRRIEDDDTDRRAAPAPSSSAPAQSGYRGPVVRVSRGTDTVVVPVAQ